MANTMKAVVLTAPNEYGIQTVDIPEPGYNEVLVRVKSVAICGSDPKVFNGSFLPMWPPKYPFIAGHEFSGEIVRLGEGVKGFAPGDRIAGEAHLGCNHCQNCAVGLYNLCLNYGKQEEGHRHYGFMNQGSYAEYAVYNARALSKLPDNVSFDEAALLDSSTTAFNAIRLIGIVPGGFSVIIGPGPIGLFAMEFAKAMGSKTIVLGRGARLEKAKEMGADFIVDITKEDAVEAVNHFTGGIRCDQVFECVGKEETVAQSIKLAKRGGKVALIGMAEKPEMLVPINPVIMDQISVIGSRASSNAFSAVLSMFSSGMIDAKVLISHTFPMEKIHEAVDIFYHRKDGAIKVVINP
jgi:L-iditol 2-dehydrogenase